MFRCYRRLHYLGAALVSAVFGVSGAAHAQQITQTITPTTSPYDAQGYRQTNFTDTTTFAFNRFNTSLGTLTSVNVTFNVTIQAGIQIENEDPVARTADATVAGTFFLRRPNSTNIVIAGPIIQTGLVSLSAYDGVTDYQGPSAFNFGTLFSNPDSEAATLSSTSDLALFSGAGTVTLPVVAIVGGSVNGPGNASVRTTSAGAPSVSIVYNYTPFVTAAPEPSTLGLLSLGLVFACAKRNRRSR